MRFVYCQPLFDERKCAHRFSYELKCVFENRGFQLERFDYHGTGEAEGDFDKVSLHSLRKDLSQRIAGKSVCLIGLRFGASLALDYSVRNPETTDKIILLEPVIDGDDYIKYLRRKQYIKDLMTKSESCVLNEPEYENIEGYKVSTEFIQQLQKFNLLKSSEKKNRLGHIYIVQITRRNEINGKLVPITRILNQNSQVVTKCFELPVFWERIPAVDYSLLTENILRWCCE